MEQIGYLDSLTDQFSKLNRYRGHAMQDRKRATERRKELLRRNVALPNEQIFGKPEHGSKDVDVASLAADVMGLTIEDVPSAPFFKRKRVQTKLGRNDRGLSVSNDVMWAREKVRDPEKRRTRKEILNARKAERFAVKADPILGPARLVGVAAKKAEKKAKKEAGR